MNTVIFLTDTQPTRMVGCYGSEWADTPNLDRLAAEGVRFDRAYTPCPLCTPARAAAFSGLVPSVAGAWANEMAPSRAFPLMGEALRGLGLRAGYTGKWHLDGAGYHGNGEVGGGFEPDWWHDGHRYLAETGIDRHRSFVRAITGGVSVGDGLTPERAAAMRAHDSAQALAEAGCRAELCWGHQVADRAIDFLERVGDEDFVLVVAPDEPHGPFITPPEWQERFSHRAIPPPHNFRADLDGKPAMQQRQAAEWAVPEWPDFLEWRLRHLRCNAWIDRQIGRVIEAVDRLHGTTTAVIATTDHGDMMGSHGLLSKGAMVYEECARIPFIARLPGGARGVSCSTPVSLLDLFPTVLDLHHRDVPPLLHGCSLAPLLRDPSLGLGREAVPIHFNRFGLYHDGYGMFYPIRAMCDGRYKLALNLLDDRDEFYDLTEDPGETRNVIDEPGLVAERDRLHDLILADMEHTSDPMRSPAWGLRSWRRVEPRRWFYGRTDHHRKRGFAGDPNNPSPGSTEGPG